MGFPAASAAAAAALVLQEGGSWRAGGCGAALTQCQLPPAPAPMQSPAAADDCVSPLAGRMENTPRRRKESPARREAASPRREAGKAGAAGTGVANKSRAALRGFSQRRGAESSHQASLQQIALQTTATTQLQIS